MPGSAIATRERHERPVLDIAGLSHAFGEGELRRRVLNGITLRVMPGEIVLLMGPSGCGKTTLLTLAGGLRSVQHGSINALGQELAGASDGILRHVRRGIGFIFQAHNLHRSLTALRNVRMGLEVHGPDALIEWKRVCRDALDRVGLADRTHAYPNELSGGQKQRVAIARALVARPRLILADEATAALDRKTGREVVTLIQTLARAFGTAILMVTHDPRIVDVADRIISMEDGRIMAGNGDAASFAGERPPKALDQSTTRTDGT